MDDGDGIVENEEEIFHQPAAASSTIGSIFSVLGSSFEFVQSNGWFILIAACIAYYLYTQWQRRQSEASRNGGSARVELNNPRHIEHAKAIEEARLRQQAAFDAAKLKYLEEKKLKEEKLAQEKAEEWERHKQGLGYHSKTKKPEESQEDQLGKLGLSSQNKDKKPRLRGADYNPLTGSSTNPSGPACYRPSRGAPSRGG